MSIENYFSPGNLGAAHFTLKRYADALSSEIENYRVCYEWHQITKCEEAHERMANAVSQKARAYQALNDLDLALASYKESVNIYGQTGNKLAQAQQLGNTGVLSKI